MYGTSKEEILKIIRPTFPQLTDQELYDLLYFGAALYKGGVGTSYERVMKILNIDHGRLGPYSRLLERNLGVALLSKDKNIRKIAQDIEYENETLCRDRISGNNDRDEGKDGVSSDPS